MTHNLKILKTALLDGNYYLPNMKTLWFPPAALEFRANVQL